MRHDIHYVEELSQHRPTQIGRLIAIDKLDPNPEQPRVDIGDLTELSASIREKGVLEPLLVKEQAAHLDVEFYDRYYPPEALPGHVRSHMHDWHDL